MFKVSVLDRRTDEKWEEEFNTLEGALSVMMHQVRRFSRTYTPDIVFMEDSMTVVMKAGPHILIEIDLWKSN